MRMPRTKHVVTIILIASGCACLACIRDIFSPSDWVMLTLRNVPVGAQQLYVVADRPEGIRALDFYFSMVTAHVEPARLGHTWFPNRLEDGLVADVQWPVARRYGILCQRKDETWLLWWLDSKDRDGPSKSRYIEGGGKADIRLPDASKAVVVSRELLDQLDLPDKR